MRYCGVFVGRNIPTRPTIKQPSGMHIQLACTIMDRYHNAKSVTIPLPTRVRQTSGALPTDRKPGCKPLPHLYCSTHYFDSQRSLKPLEKVLCFSQNCVSYTHFTIRFRHFCHISWTCGRASWQGSEPNHHRTEYRG